MRRILLALLALLTLGGAVAACGDDGGGDDNATKESEPEEKPYGIEAVFKDNSGYWFSLTQHK